jgi:hypothetical protein
MRRTCQSIALGFSCGCSCRCAARCCQHGEGSVTQRPHPAQHIPHTNPGSTIGGSAAGQLIFRCTGTSSHVWGVPSNAQPDGGIGMFPCRVRARGGGGRSWTETSIATAVTGARTWTEVMAESFTETDYHHHHHYMCFQHIHSAKEQQVYPDVRQGTTDSQRPSSATSRPKCRVAYDKERRATQRSS